jgi:hypothetical protein
MPIRLSNSERKNVLLWVAISAHSKLSLITELPFSGTRLQLRPPGKRESIGQRRVTSALLPRWPPIESGNFD